jgi:hypothetical protein
MTLIETVEQMEALFADQLSSVRDPIVLDALKTLAVLPRPHIREWFYGDPELQYLCWMVLEHPESGIGIVYSDYGFGPESPWGLVFLKDNLIGEDCGWFGCLERAFYDSYGSLPLKIWNVLEKEDDGQFRFLEGPLTDDEAYQITHQLYEMHKPKPNAYFSEPRYYPYYTQADRLHWTWNEFRF